MLTIKKSEQLNEAIEFRILSKAQEFKELFIEKIEFYKTNIEKLIDYLQREYQLNDYPKLLIWTSFDDATRLLSDVQYPAYTNDKYIVFSADLDKWKFLLMDNVKHLENKTINHYFNKLDENYLLCVLGHEITHHLDLFVLEWDNNTQIWFEEGMCHYLPRKKFLSKKAFDEIYRIEKMIVEKNEIIKEMPSINLFTPSSYDSFDNATIEYFYALSFVMIADLVEKKNLDIFELFKLYESWSLNYRSTMHFDKYLMDHVK